MIDNIRIHHECEGGIEKSPRFTDWHHEACRGMANRDHEGRIFISHSHTNNGFFSCSPLNNLYFTLEKHEKSFKKNLNTLI